MKRMQGRLNLSKSTTERFNYYTIMKLIADQINTFEGIITAHVEATDDNTYECKVYLKIVAHGDYIINPTICVTEITQETTDLFMYLGKFTHNEYGDNFLAIILTQGDLGINSCQLTIEGTTNSPIDYDEVSDESATYNKITDSSKYSSTISYSVFDDDTIRINFKLGFPTG